MRGFVIINRRWRRLPTGLAMLAMLGKLVAPAGFMPADLSGGHWLMICPEGLPSGVLDTGQHDHGHGEHNDHDGDDRPLQLGLDQCPIGAAAGFAAIVTHGDPIPEAAEAEWKAEAPRLPARRRGAFSAQARAPPAAIDS